MTDDTYGPRTAAWRSLAWHSRRAASSDDRFSCSQEDPRRFERFSREAKVCCSTSAASSSTQRALELLLALAEETEVRRWIELMFAGYPVNNTEDRPALHIALRRPADRPLLRTARM